MKSLFAVSERVLARALSGRTLVAGDQEATILVAEPFDLARHCRGLYEPIRDATPGAAYTSGMFGHTLLHIRAGRPGCVTLKSILLNGYAVEGSGRVTAALGITTARVLGSLRVRPDQSLVLDLPGGFTPSKMPKRLPTKASGQHSSGNGLGEAMIAIYMPRIVQLWLRQKRRGKFTPFANAILAGCPDEAALQRVLRRLEA